MQYKIPVQIENADPILLGLSLKQLMIILIGGGIGYSIFSSLAPSTGPELALIPAAIITLFAVVIALFKYAGMNFIEFVLAFIRLKVNMQNRKWVKATDSYSLMDIGYVTSIDKKDENKIDFKDKMDKIKEMDEKINKI